jgi:hypothetical protein
MCGKYTIGFFVACACLLARPTAHAALIQVATDADTTITRHPNLGAGHTPQGGSGFVSTIARYHGWGDLQLAHALVHFDLSAYAGQTALADATVSLKVSGYYSSANFGAPTTQTVNLYRLLVPWDEATATYDNVGGHGSGVAGGDYAFGAGMDGRIVSIQDNQMWVSWTVPASLVQSWIDNPSTNHGLLFSPYGYDAAEFYYYSRESGQAPFMQLEITPEPASFMLLAGVGLFADRHRRRDLQRNVVYLRAYLRPPVHM